MNKEIRTSLIKKAKVLSKNNDSSHDFSHAKRVLMNAEYIAQSENADFDIIIPAALFHDIVCYPKNDVRSNTSSDESAEVARHVLKLLDGYPTYKISIVEEVIKQCSYRKGIIPDLLESKVIQDADRLEATGAISIMRTFSSVGSMNKQLYNEEDPFCLEREPNSIEYGLDLFFTRLLKVEEQMHTVAAKMMARKRTKILNKFIDAFKEEIAI
ncbi:HD domain-containing protein [Haloplasma contractile]|uniref:Metal dependent phosphohydrolase protein n=1 Tax=Haloplasma contractile SSD-17B TaxID=1033810 RepID=F7Q2H2_9MOLU|nr:HD domain-containing protein [Haloplasma contractile]ERJ11956.1 Metal dependent phosphohydrolase protein [Haloplasma contractile SSD-17B]